jgi:DNA-binding transcriptional LysR family regulator
MLPEDIHMFIVLAECKNYTNAADMLYISQSSLSKHIKKLEDSIGVKLFVRTTKSVELSQYGMIYYKYAKQIQTAAEACMREIHDTMSHGNSLVIGCIPSILQYHISAFIFRYMSKSESQCQIKTDRSIVLEEMLLNGRCDFAFIRDVNTSLPLASIPFTEDHLMAVLPKNHHLANSDEIHIKELRDEKLLLHPKGSRPYNNIISMCKNEDFEPNVIYTDSHMRTICTMVSYGMGISLLMENLIPIDVDGICAVPIAPTVTSKITLCHVLEHELTPQQKKFLSFYRAEKHNYQKYRQYD